MTDFKAKSSIYSIMIMIGGLIGIIAVFMAWIDIDFGILGSYTMSGWEITTESLKNPSLGNIDDNYVRWMPLLVLIFSVVGLLIGLTALLKPRKEIGAGAVVCGILAILAGILFYINDNLSDVIGLGVFIAMAAGVLLVITGALRMSVN
ncbi:MAG: hypothetical protein LBH88_01955 [Candidatus Methanoplasma sp.]|jgi:hypothetical protein|nr:hypothetical protein [Candidatus Methanoplasma sp.]